jgi:hypothetical protein
MAGKNHSIERWQAEHKDVAQTGIAIALSEIRDTYAGAP